MVAAMAATDDAGQPCIRCGDCAQACPEGLDPRVMLLRLRDRELAHLRTEGALDCSECGRCDLACPSRIPLIERYREAKALLLEEEARRSFSLAARERYRARQARFGRDEDERTERRVEREASATSADAVAAAVARARARRAALRKDPKDG